MRVRVCATRIAYSFAGALLSLVMSDSSAFAQDGHVLHAATEQRAGTADQKSRDNELVAIVREVTERFQDVAAAEAAGYQLQFGCVSGDDFGAMGLHYVNGPLVADGEIDAARPEIIIYEARSGGRLKLLGADYLVLADAWNARHSAPPQLMGQAFHLFDSPNRFGLPPFYTLHVWAWKENPNGTFVNWHPDVTCDAFNPQN